MLSTPAASVERYWKAHSAFVIYRLFYAILNKLESFMSNCAVPETNQFKIIHPYLSLMDSALWGIFKELRFVYVF